MKHVAALIEVLAVLLLCFFSYNAGLFKAKQEYDNLHPKQHDLCYDNEKQIAWIAEKDGELRCFLEYREYPHRVKAANLS